MLTTSHWNARLTEKLISQPPHVEDTADAHADTVGPQLYSPAMLAELLQESVRKIRLWHRAGLLEPTTTVMRVPYFGYMEIARAKQLSRWMQQGLSVASIQRQLELIHERLGDHPARSSVRIVAVGKRLVAKQDDVVIEAFGQLQFGFESSDEAQAATLKFQSAAVDPCAPARATCNE